MGNLARLFGTSKALEVEGVEVDLGDGLKVTVARAGNKKAQALSDALIKRHRVQVRNRNLPEDVQERIAIEVMAKTILLGWTGATDGDQPIDYSTDNAIAMLTKYKDFREQIADLARDITLFQEEVAEEEQKN